MSLQLRGPHRRRPNAPTLDFQPRNARATSALFLGTGSTLIPIYEASPFRTFPECYPTSLQPLRDGVPLCHFADEETGARGGGTASRGPRSRRTGSAAGAHLRAHGPAGAPSHTFKDQSRRGRAASRKGSSRRRPGRAPGPSTAGPAVDAELTPSIIRAGRAARAARFSRRELRGPELGLGPFPPLIPPSIPRPFHHHVAKAQSPVTDKSRGPF